MLGIGRHLKAAWLVVKGTAERKGTMTFQLSKKSGSVVAMTAGALLASVLTASASAEFYRHMVGGVWEYETDTIFEELGEFEEEALWNQKEYEHYDDQGSGFYVDVRQISVLIKFSGTNEDPFEFGGDPDFPDYNGWRFTDVDGTIAAFESVEGVGRGRNVDWSQVDYGVVNEDEFYVNFNGIAGTELVDGDSFRLVINFVPAPAAGMAALLGFGIGVGRRRRS